MVFDAADFAGRPAEGCWPVHSWPDRFHWQQRADAEHNEEWLQPIPYLLLSDRTGRLWGYRRRDGDQRLIDSLSCGLGGHVEYSDRHDSLPQTLAAALRRELEEELTNSDGVAFGHALGWLYEKHSAIGRVHIGIVYLARWDKEIPPSVTPGEALETVGFFSPESIADDHRFELWSRLATRFLLNNSYL